MNLSLENLEEIHRILLISKDGVDGVSGLMEIDIKVEPTPEKRQQINHVFEFLSSESLKISHINSFLQSCDIYDVETLNAEQQELLIKCQSLSQSFLTTCKKALKHLIGINKEFNEALCPISDKQEPINSVNSLFEKYKRKRKILK